MGAIDRRVQDADHPSSDGVIMGRDRLGGFTLQFECRILSEYPVTEKPWIRALDLYSQFAAKWRADSVRLDPGQYATMTNDDRQRMVYGRPRDIAPKSAMLRKGVYDFQMDFVTNGPNWVDRAEKVAIFTGPLHTSGGIRTPLTSPITTIRPINDTNDLVNAGDLHASPVIELHGPTPACSLELFQGTDRKWVIRVPDRIKYDEVITVDTRFWRRSATLNEKEPANGRIRGDQLEFCTIPVGQFNARFRHQDQSGRAHAVIRWRDTYAGP